MKKQTRYTREYKLDACRLVTETGLKCSAVAEQLGINPDGWGSITPRGDGAFVGKGKARRTQSCGDCGVKTNGCGRRLRPKKAKAYFEKHQEK